MSRSSSKFLGHPETGTALRLDLAQGVDRLTCCHCGGTVRRVRGGIFDGRRFAGLYAADLHRRGRDRRVVLAVCVLGRAASAPAQGPCSAVVEVWPTATQLRMSIRDVADSPFRPSDLVGQVMGREEVLASPICSTVFRLADEVIGGDRRVRAHLI